MFKRCFDTKVRLLVSPIRKSPFSFLVSEDQGRQETAASVTHLINLLHQHGSKGLPNKLRVLDLCTGSGCIPLLSHYEFCQKHGRKSENLEVVGVDISPLALALAKKNLHRLVADGTILPSPRLQFLQADILASKEKEAGTEILPLESALQQYDLESVTPGIFHCDILISNPPYISPAAFAHTTTRSVKRYEPLLALVPPSTQSLPNQTEQGDRIDQGDLFYPRLLSIAASLSVKVALFEVADLQQAKRVAAMAENQKIWDGVEIWRDDPSSHDYQESPAEMVMDGKIKVVGAGNGRSVVVHRGVGRNWMGIKDPI